jgi:proteasome lid subunit RPN8/RPN11
MSSTGHLDLSDVTQLLLPAPCSEALRARAATSSEEICGLLVGLVSGSRIDVVRDHPLTNAEASAERFSVVPTEYAAALAQLAGGEIVAAMYHSHMGAPEPSGRDLEHMADSPFPWLILGNAGKRDANRIQVRLWESASRRRARPSSWRLLPMRSLEA